jgi:hypothetical protein
MSTPERPLFFTVRKNSSYISWTPYGEFFSFEKVCIEVVSETEFIMWLGDCLETYRLGRKRLVYATRERKKLKNGIYRLAGEQGGKYIFKYAAPL